jgi:hypothetical protein
MPRIKYFNASLLQHRQSHRELHLKVMREMIIVNVTEVA